MSRQQFTVKTLKEVLKNMDDDTPIFLRTDLENKGRCIEAGHLEASVSIEDKKVQYLILSPTQY